MVTTRGRTPKREPSESQKAGLEKARAAATRSRRMKQYQGLLDKVGDLETDLFGNDVPQYRATVSEGGHSEDRLACAFKFLRGCDPDKEMEATIKVLQAAQDTIIFKAANRIARTRAKVGSKVALSPPAPPPRPPEGGEVVATEVGAAEATGEVVAKEVTRKAVDRAVVVSPRSPTANYHALSDFCDSPSGNFPQVKTFCKAHIPQNSGNRGR